MITALIALALSTGAQTSPAAAQASGPPAPDCVKLMVAEPTSDIATLCAGEAAMRLAANAAAGSPERSQHLREAAAQYSRAAELLKNLEMKIYAYEAVVRVHDASNLNEPAVVEPALRQLATLVAGTPAPLMRLAQFQEGHDGVDRAEHTLLGARQQYPDSLSLLRELSAFFARRVLALLPKSSQEGAAPPNVQPAKAAEPAYRPACQEFSFGNPTSALAVLCLAEAEMRKAAPPAKPSADPAERARAADARKQHLRAAAEQYSRAAEMFREIEPKTYAYETLVRIYSAQNLNEPREAEQAVRQLIVLAPNSAAPLIRLSSVQEAQKLVDAAEATLLNARQQFPDDVEPLKALSRFYARLATAAAMTEARRGREQEAPRAPGHPDENGFYSVGAHIPPPKKERDVRPAFPKEAQAVELDGIVIVELFLDENGAVTDAHLSRPIPMLDEAALEAVKQWRFQPTIIDGRAVPTRLTVTVNFTLQKK
jgi:TonB family protein